MNSDSLALRARIAEAHEALEIASIAAVGLQHDGSDAEIHALALYATVIELFSGCIALAEKDEPTGLPILLRSIYEAMVDLENLLVDPSYVEYVVAATLRQMLRIMKSRPLHELKEGRSEEYEQFKSALNELESRGIRQLSIRDKCARAQRLDEFESLYGLLCLDTHNNGAALAERHLSERTDGVVQISLFSRQDPLIVARRINVGLSFSLQSAQMIHRAFKVPAPRIDMLASKLARNHVRKLRADSGEE